MLESTPGWPTSDTNIAMWELMKPLTNEMLQEYWDEVESDAELFDVDQVRFDTWRVDNNGYWLYVGMKDLFPSDSTHLMRGINRWMHPNSMGEGTFVDGEHGLKRSITDGSVRVSLNKQNSERAYFTFGSDFVETDRGGTFSAELADLSPADFQL